MDEIYYRILFSPRDGTIDIVCMQDFDECDYDHSRYLTTQKFDTEEEASQFLRDQKESGIRFPQPIQKALDECTASYMFTNIFDN